MDNTLTFGVPDNLCRRAGVTGTWISSNTIGVHAYNHVTYRSKDKPSDFAPSEAYVHLVRPEVIIFDSVLRKLVNEANDVFLRVQQIDKHSKNIPGDIWLKMSRRYRSIIRECLESLQEAENQTDGSLSKKYSNYITIFYSVECVWHLIEILYVDQIPGNAILNPLLEWIRFHFPEHERKATTFLTSSLISSAEIDPHFWDTVIGVFLHGQIDVTRALLKLHSAWESLPFQMADKILRIMPLYNVYGGMSVNDFQQRWKHWQLDTKTKIDSKTFATQKQLDILMKLAVGDGNTWESEGVDRCETWYECLASRLLYSEPYVTRAHLGQLATKFFSAWPTTNRHIDQTLLAIMRQDLHQVINEIQQMSENGWFAAHITDLLYHCGELSIIDSKQNDSKKLRDSLLQDYGTLLMGHHSLWQVGTQYLSHSNFEGLQRLALLLERLPLESEARSLKIIQVAEKYDFQHVVASICRQRAMLALRRNRFGHALGWTLKSRDVLLSSLIADSLLKEYCSSGKLIASDLLHSFGASMLISDRLLFLAKYFEFHKVYNAKQFKEAASLLTDLLKSKLTPKYFWKVLFTDAIPLLECDKIVLSSNDTYEFLHCIQQNCNDSNLSDIIELIRFAAARNLARALTQEIQATAAP